MCALHCKGLRWEDINEGMSSRELSVGDQILLGVPGMHGALEASWEGPYKVKAKLSKANYRITDSKERDLRLFILTISRGTSPGWPK